MNILFVFVNIHYFTQYEYEQSLHRKIMSDKAKFCWASTHLGWTNRNSKSFLFMSDNLTNGLDKCS